MAKTQQNGGELEDLDPLAAVVLHTLVSQAREGYTLTQIAIACRRDPTEAADIGEIEAAVRVLLEDGLAEHENGEHEGGPQDERKGEGEVVLYRPTRAAIRANELSF